MIQSIYRTDVLFGVRIMRTILHSDLNNFYASVECLYDPSHRDMPVAVCGDPKDRHGIVLAKNMCAQKMGVATGEVIWKALGKCPDLVIVPPDFPKYTRFSRMMREIYREYSDFIEPFGLDEAWLDVTGHSMEGVKIADELRRRAREELGLTLSVGVSFNKIFAKLGSDMRKPDATTVILPEDFREKVWPLPVQELLYVGPATFRKLCRRNLHTIGELAKCPPEVLRAMLGRHGEMLWSFANGLDQSPVMPVDYAEDVKSVGNSTTAPRDLQCEGQVHQILTVLGESIAERLRHQDLQGNVVGISVRDNGLFTFTRRRKLTRPTALAAEIIPCAMALFRESYRWERPVRSVGVNVSGITTRDEVEQMSMFPDRERKRTYLLESAVEDIRRRFGYHSILRANLISDKEIGELNPREEHVIFPVGWKNRTDE